MVKLLFTGDIVINKSHHIIHADLQQIYHQHDSIIANLEAPICKTTKPNLKAGPSLKQGHNFLKESERIGITHFTLANNHIFDYGEQGLQQTIEALDEKQMQYCGAHLQSSEVYKPTIIEVNNQRIAIFSFSEAEFGHAYSKQNKAGYGYINDVCVNTLITHAKNEFDIVIIVAHVGIEHINIPLSIWRDRFKELIDLGADAIIGHHPHVAQGIEYYNEKPIFYSLGNFFMDKENTDNEWGFCASLEIKNHVITAIEVIPHIKQNNQLHLYPEGIQKLKELSILLEDDNYSILEQEQLKDLYQRIYEKELQKSTFGYSQKQSYFKKTKRKLAMSLFKEKNKIKNDLNLYHLLLKDSHRYVITENLKNQYDL